MIDEIITKLKYGSYTPYYIERINLLEDEYHHHCQALTGVVKSVRVFDDFHLIDEIQNPLFRLNCYADLLDSKDMKYSYNILNKIEQNNNTQLRVDSLYNYLKDYHRKKNTMFDAISLVPKHVNNGGFLEIKLDTFLESIASKKSTPNLIIKKTKELIHGFLEEIPKYSFKKNYLLKNAYFHLFSHPEYTTNLTSILLKQELEEKRKKGKKLKELNSKDEYYDSYDFLRNRLDLQSFIDRMTGVKKK